MKTQIQNLLLAFALCGAALSVHAQGTAFTYQGRLNENGIPASGSYDLQFSLRDAAAGGNPVGGTNTIAPVPVSNGLFTVTLDFGSNVFTGGDRWLEIGVKSNGVAGAHTPLAPLQPLTPSPYAIFAGGAQTASTVATGGVSTGSIALGAVNSSAIADGSIESGDLNSSLLNGTFWRLNGNSGPGNFLGSTDFRSLEFRVNGTPALRLTPTPSGVNIIGGYSSNSVRPGMVGATISGGGEPDYPNRAEADFSAIVGGVGNTNSSRSSFIGGGAVNTIQSSSLGAGVIGGGQLNIIANNGFVSVIAGGQANVISNNARYSTISGGDSHVIETNSRWATIGGGRLNFAAGTSTTVAGGERNTAANSFSTVGGGLRNSAAGGNSVVAGGAVAGGSDNFAGTNASFIGGGNHNANISLSAVIGGGEANSILNVSDYATIGGGRQNTIQTNADYSMIGGGYQNVVHSSLSVVGGGWRNSIQTNASRSVLAGGERNTNSSTYSVIAGGLQNWLQPNTSLSAIGGGWLNTIQEGADQSVIAGGNAGMIQGGARESFIGGGFANTIGSNAANAFIGGGVGGVNAGYAATIAGGFYNSVSNNGATVGGGGVNVASGVNSVVAGGSYNRNSGFNSAIGGGEANVISNTTPHATIAGGLGNLTSAGASFTGGGSFNANNSPGGVIGGGYINRTENFDAVVGGGGFNVSAGYRATVPGGAFNDALGAYSFASGYRAKAIHPGAFVWADATEADFASTSNNQFSVRASGGVRLVTGGAGITLDGQPVLSGTVSSAQLADGSVTAAKIPAGQVVKSLNSLTDHVALVAGTNVTITPSGNTLQIAATFLGPVSDSQLSANVALRDAHQTFSGENTFNNNVIIADPATLIFGSSFRQMLDLLDGRYGIGVQKHTVYFRTHDDSRDNGFAWFRGGRHSDDLQDSGGGDTLMTLTEDGLTVDGTVTATAFNPPSDRNLKENFLPVNPRDVLDKIAAMPISRWNFKSDTATPHVGPMAQDFHAAFGLGTDNKHIATVDADGVALAAIQGLNEVVKEKDAEIQELKRAVKELKESFQKLAHSSRAEQSRR